VVKAVVLGVSQPLRIRQAFSALRQARQNSTNLYLGEVGRTMHPPKTYFWEPGNSFFLAV